MSATGFMMSDLLSWRHERAACKHTESTNHHTTDAILMPLWFMIYDFASFTIQVENRLKFEKL